MDTVVTNMAESQFYASVYAGSLQVDLDSNGTTEAFRESMKSALPEFYAAVLVFSTRAKGYFLPLGSGELLFPPVEKEAKKEMVVDRYLPLSLEGGLLRSQTYTATTDRAKPTPRHLPNGFYPPSVLTFHLAKLTNYLQPFSITLEPCIQEIDVNRQKLERFASMATMERIRGSNEPCRLRVPADDLIHSNSELRKCSVDLQIPR